VVHRVVGRIRRGRPRVPTREGCRWLPLPVARRAGAVRRALPARWTAGTDEWRGTGDARDRRLQTTAVTCPDRLDPWRRSRRSTAHVAGAWLRHRGGPRLRPRASDPVRHDAVVSREARIELAR